jgi:uncharacterized protein YjdB
MRSTLRPVSPRARARWIAMWAVALFLGSVSCIDRIPTGLREQQASRRQVSINPHFQRIQEGGPRILLSRVEGVLIGPGNSRFPASALFIDGVADLLFEVEFIGALATFRLELRAFDMNGELAYETTDETITVRPGTNPLAVAEPELHYAAPDAALAAITVAPNEVTLAAGASQTLTVSGRDANNGPVTVVNIGWTSRNGAIADVDENGVVTAGRSSGATWIVAASAVDGVLDSARVTVRAPVDRVIVTPATTALSRGQSQTFAAELRDAGNVLLTDRVVAWSSSDPSVITINASTGAAQAVGNGNATITATSETKTGTASVSVGSPVERIDLSPTSRTFVSFGTSQQFTATIVPKPGATVAGLSVAWSIDNPSVATVDGSGLVTARGNGSATVTASADGVTRTASITVAQTIARVTISPRSLEFDALGSTGGLTAVALDANGARVENATITWASSASNVATVSQQGDVSSAGNGTATITATSGSVSDEIRVTVAQTISDVQMTAGRTTIPVGQTEQFEASAVDRNNNKMNGRVTWRSSNAAVATVNADGLVAGVSPGSATIFAKVGDTESGIDVTIQSTGGGSVSGRVINGASLAGIVGATVSSSGSATTTTGGSFVLPGVSSGATVSASASGFVSTQYFDVHTTGGQTTAIGDIPLAPVSTANGTITGTVKNAVSGQGVGGALVVARSGINATTGAILGQATANSSGVYSLSLPAGTYTLTASASGFTPGTHMSVSIGGQTLASQNPVVVPVGTGNEIRIVLTWGPNPRDLDSHLFGPNGSSGFHVYYGAPTAFDAQNNLLASLDQDITGGFGPETVTIPSQGAGTYKYAIHHFSGTQTMSTAGATVNVYRGGTLIASFHPPAGAIGGGDVWHVFDLTGTNITSVNTISRNFPGSGGSTLRAGDPVADAVRAAAAAHPKPPR